MILSLAIRWIKRYNDKAIIEWISYIRQEDFGMKQGLLIVGIVLSAVLLAGCTGGVDSITTNTMTVHKDGKIADVSVEDFSDGDYSMTDLEQFVTDEVNDYNTTNGDGSIEIKEIQTENSLAKLELTYQDMATYNAFNHTEYVLEDAAQAGLSGDFTVKSDGTTVKVADIDTDGLKVLEVSDAMNIVCKGKVQYYNSYVTEVNGTYTASGEGIAVIVFK